MAEMPGFETVSVSISASERFNSFCELIHLPTNTGETIIKSGIFSFAISVLMSGNVEISLIIGGVAATASLIHALTRPIIEIIFKLKASESQIPWDPEILIMIVNLSLTQLLLNHLTPYKVNLLGSAILTMTMFLFVRGFKSHYKLKNNTVYIMV
jgi:hypothetical protein